MTFSRYMLAVAAMAAPSSASAHEIMPAGIWTNTEDQYFAQEEGREKPDWVGYEVSPDGTWRPINAFGEALSEWSQGDIVDLARRGEGGWQIGESELRKARNFSCWVSVRRYADKPDGSADWSFVRNLSNFDQGGRVLVPGDGTAPDVTIRLRNVTWASGSRNKPSLVLYIHKDDPVRAESYSWAAPESTMVGVNLGWVQASCSRDGIAMGATREALVQAGQEWLQLYDAGNWNALRRLYTADAVLMTANQEKIVGADNILGFLQRLSQAGASVKFQFDAEEAVVELPFGFVTAKYRMDISFPGKEPVQVAGRSHLVYRWKDGRWKLWRDMDNFAPDVTLESFEE